MSQDFILSLALGLGLATAVGFRVFVPLFILGIAVHWGYVPATSGFEWVGSTAALIMFAVAALVEITAFYVPVLDNALSVIAAPVAIAAGIGVTALALGDAPPMLKWTLAIIAGGGAAAATHGATSLLRGASTLATIGVGNPVISTVEIFAAIIMSLLALILPYIALAVAVIVMIVVVRRWRMRQEAAKT